jgi:hypothetical protein
MGIRFALSRLSRLLFRGFATHNVAPSLHLSRLVGFNSAVDFRLSTLLKHSLVEFLQASFSLSVAILSSLTQWTLLSLRS